MYGKIYEIYVKCLVISKNASAIIFLNKIVDETERNFYLCLSASVRVFIMNDRNVNVFVNVTLNFVAQKVSKFIISKKYLKI